MNISPTARSGDCPPGSARNTSGSPSTFVAGRVTSNRSCSVSPRGGHFHASTRHGPVLLGGDRHADQLAARARLDARLLGRDRRAAAVGDDELDVGALVPAAADELPGGNLRREPQFRPPRRPRE